MSFSLKMKWGGTENCLGHGMTHIESLILKILTSAWGKAWPYRVTYIKDPDICVGKGMAI